MPSLPVDTRMLALRRPAHQYVQAVGNLDGLNLRGGEIDILRAGI